MHALLMSLYLSSVGLALVLLARRPARRLLGAGPAFTLWLLPPLLALTPCLPSLPAHRTVASAGVALPDAQSWLTSTLNVTATPAASHALASA